MSSLKCLNITWSVFQPTQSLLHRDLFYVSAYPVFGFFLNQTGRPMVYCCSWAAAQVVHDIKVGRATKHTYPHFTFTLLFFVHWRCI